jgi:hypothetical protein
MPTVCRFASCHLSRRPVAYTILTFSLRGYVPEGHILITRWCFLTTRDHLYRPWKVRQPFTQPNVRYFRWPAGSVGIDAHLGSGAVAIKYRQKKKFSGFPRSLHTNANLVPRVKQGPLPSMADVFNSPPARMCYIIYIYIYIYIKSYM